mmetsp:Transcript_3949/g.5205  ORF Transcript_3949/g.5205 Transcript_3949/m.5205 type:complete len:364 (-) Transcript_3949:239-1330(-)|eukprot:CAMPEP_0198145268 /NCGR_PEP_ID=MMETSP1443-20131203/22381_1 /TAXON_ID=186043 /ORGANISM="Entomoneis sp., Strain CCMP2396" /LENGTH=363 /DNA_ID=CAMNT_0043808861 /DNA_START=141 /DNA_END=1232 /DNA_ORIENTATION=+
MCGRTVQSQSAVFAAATSLRVRIDQLPSNDQSASEEAGQAEQGTSSKSEQSSGKHEWKDNFNLSPGMDAMVFFKDGGNIRMERKVWGLITRGGTKASPLPTGMNQHFQALMFNARSDTLYEKPSFSRLASMKRTCVVAVDGFFEWTTPTMKGKKQPHFAYRKRDSDKPYLLLAGLWTSVQTGREESPVLDTFTLITTEVCKSLEWLHSRMPVCIWNEDLARMWLENPSESILRKLEMDAKQTAEGYFQWDAVTTEMSSTKYRSRDAIKPLPKLKTVKSFFTSIPVDQKSKDFSFQTKQSSIKIETEKRQKAGSFPAEPGSALKQQYTSIQSSSPNKKRKTGSKVSKKEPVEKGSITSFFTPRK